MKKPAHHLIAEVPRRQSLVEMTIGIRTNGVFVFLRGFSEDPTNLQPTVKNMEGIRIYP